MNSRLLAPLTLQPLSDERTAEQCGVKEYEGRAHLLPAQEGWEEVADCALEWALANATQPAAIPADPA
jgi:hypothetical protein